MRDLESPPRLYIVTRADLPVGLAAAQAAHAAFQFATRRADITKNWLRDSQYLIVVTVPNEDALIRLASTANAAGVTIETFHEPDLNDETTAVAFEPGDTTRTYCGYLPLLGRQVPVALTG